MLPSRLIPAAILAALLVLPAPATASGWSMRTIALQPQAAHGLLAEGRWRTSRPAAAPADFRAVGLLWRGAAAPSFEVRTAPAGGSFGAWRALDGDDAVGSARGRASDPLWIGRARRVQVRARGAVRALRVVVIDPGADPPHRAARRSREAGVGVAQPLIVSRAEWGADETLRGQPRFAPALRYAVVHHTAGSNDYAQADAAAVVRSIYLYHARTLGWSDIGYGFLVDRFGTIYEGRAGGVERPVVGAHVYGFNTGSVGASVLGNYETALPSPEALDALARLLAWRLDVAHLDPLARVRTVSGGGDRYPAGTTVEQPMIAGHRDYGATACPGANLYAVLDPLRAAVAAVPGLRIWDPRPAAVDPALPDGPVRVTARLSASGSWRVQVLDAAGTVVAEGAGAGALVDYTWPGAPGAVVADLTYRIEAGSGTAVARPATGRLDGRDAVDAEELPGVPASDFAARPRVLTPNADGSGDTGTVSWRQGLAAHASLYLDTAEGTPVIVVDGPRDRGPGTQQVAWAGADATGVPLVSGRYQYRLVLEPAGLAPIVLTAPVDVRRGVAGLRVTRFVSPNGDGRAEHAAISFDRVEPGPLRVRVARGATSVATLVDLPDSAGPQSLDWDGGGLPDGPYRVTVEAPGAGGTLVVASRLTIDRTPPRARVVTLRRRGRVVRLTLRFSEQVVWRLQSRGAVLRRGERPGRLRLELPRGRLGRTATLYLRDRAGNAAPPRVIRIP